MKRIKQSIMHPHIQSSTISTEKWGFHVTILISLTFWLCAFLLFGNFADAAKKLEHVRCAKDKIGNDNCTCPEDPITEKYIDMQSKSCDTYYLCHMGAAMKMPCPQFTAFHPKLKRCLPQKDIPKTLCKPKVKCPPKGNAYVQDKNDCTKFYLCFLGKYFHWSCPEEEYFDALKTMCIADRTQAEACLKAAKKKFFTEIGLGPKDPPVSHTALSAAQAYLKKHEIKA